MYKCVDGQLVKLTEEEETVLTEKPTVSNEQKPTLDDLAAGLSDAMVAIMALSLE